MDAQVGDQLSITYSTDDGLIEVAAAGVNKGQAMAGLAQAWGIDAADAVAFGDMPNDLEMLTWAGHGVAMANAHPDLAAIATEIAPHHGDDGVAASWSAGSEGFANRDELSRRGTGRRPWPSTSAARSSFPGGRPTPSPAVRC